MYHLREIVSEFNRGFLAWAEDTGCVANFSWRYDRASGQKFLDVTEIDIAVYRSEPPSDVDVRAALDKVRT